MKEWIEDPGWSGVFSYALRVDGVVVGRVYQSAHPGRTKSKRQWKGFLNGNVFEIFISDGSLKDAKRVLIGMYNESKPYEKSLVHSSE